jgi:hypothetical protein
VRLRATLSFSGSLPYLAGGIGGVVLAILLFDLIDPRAFRRFFGAFLMVYAVSTVLRPQSALLAMKARPVGHTAIGFAGGLVGGLTAMPGAVLAVWCDAHAMPKTAQRAVVQPFITAMQSLALVILFLKAPGFDVVLDWRCQQEADLLGVAPDHLPQAERERLAGFIQYFERITRRMLAGGVKASVTVALDRDRRPCAKSPA